MLSFDGKTIIEVAEDIERRMVEDVLNKHHWNKQKAAQELGLSRRGIGEEDAAVGDSLTVPISK